MLPRTAQAMEAASVILHNPRLGDLCAASKSFNETSYSLRLPPRIIGNPKINTLLPLVMIMTRRRFLCGLLHDSATAVLCSLSQPARMVRC